MSTTMIGAEVRRYLDAVRAHLDDLRESERDELLQDLEEHLLEVEAEDEGTLEARLGPPDVYAQELRASVGFPTREDRTSQGALQRAVTRLVRTSVWRSISNLAETSAGRASLEFTRELRPGWWVLRGYLVILAGFLIAGDYPGPGTAQIRDYLPLPLHDGALIAGLLATVPCVVLSVWLGRRAERSKRARRVSIVLSLVVGVALIGAITGWGGDAQYYPDEGMAYSESLPYLHHADGTTIANICPYSSEGKLLSGILLFDQFGRPITNSADNVDGRAIEPAAPAILNVYPKTISLVDVQGEVYDPRTGAAQIQKTLTPLPCPGAVTASPAQPGPAAGGIPTPIR
jgi:HAAS domain-containing protein